MDKNWKISELCLIYTDKCNLNCRHCINNSNSHKNSRIDINKAKETIQFAIKNKIPRISFTGGEPFLFEKEILELIKGVNRKSKTFIITNGFWARDLKTAHRKLLKFHKAGLGNILVSCDEFHQEFVDFSNILNIYWAAKKIGLNFGLKILKIKDKYSNWDAICKHFKNKKVVYYGAPLINYGRAKTLKLKIFSISQLKGCPCGFGDLAVNSNLDVFICSGPSFNFDKKNPLYLGNLKKNKLEQMIKRAKANSLFKTIHFDHVHGILSKLPKNIKNKIIKKKFPDLCSLCVNVLNRKDVQHFIGNCNRKI